MGPREGSLTWPIFVDVPGRRFGGTRRDRTRLRSCWNGSTGKGEGGKMVSGEGGGLVQNSFEPTDFMDLTEHTKLSRK